MKQTRLFGAVAALLLAGSLCAPAQDRGEWRATSSSAKSITGDVFISDVKLSINFLGFPVAHIRTLEAKESSALFSDDTDEHGFGNLYRLNVPAAQRFLHKNTLCGSEDTQWMVTYVNGRSLRIAFFSGPAMPVFTMEAISNSSELCGTFGYAR